VTTSSDNVKSLAALLRRIRESDLKIENVSEHVGAIDSSEPMLGELVFSLLLWNSTTTRAMTAFRRIARSVVDFNELRVCLPNELISLIGERYSRSHERAQRLRACLADIYKREHSVTLKPVSALGKREARGYLETLDGLPDFAVSRIVLLHLDGHAAPIDDRICSVLAEHSVVPGDISSQGAAALIERRCRAGELADTYHMLQGWADHHASGDSRASATTTDGEHHARTSQRQRSEHRRSHD
jgi:hypothetical protein